MEGQCPLQTQRLVFVYADIKPGPKVQALLDKYFGFSLSSMLSSLATTTNIALQAHFA